MKTESEVGHHMASSTLNVDAFRDYLETQLKRSPPLPDVEQISPRVIRVLGQNPGEFTLQGTNTYIVGTGRSRLIIDTGQGSPQWIENVVSLLGSMGVILSHVLLTHWHGDHTGGVADLMKSYPHLTTAIYKNSPARDQNNIIDGQPFSVEGATVRALHTPGHAHDHMCFVLEEENAMFTGDNILGHGTTAVEELGPIMSSWRRMLTQNCERGYPGHGQLIHNLNHKITEQLASGSEAHEHQSQAIGDAGTWERYQR
ncbi:hypothetical protein E8E14_001356 [Neopestalotiopsis sp. 37M]|nr:hypothetical protein E8E14_001356 [Neopestalotiopsis sp. 37M]